LSLVDYSDAILKLQRADSHIRDLDYIVFTYLQTKPYDITHESHLISDKHGFYISLTEKPPKLLQTVIGDAVHNLRATLDYLIAAIAVANGKSPNDTAFVTAEDSTALEMRLKDKVKKAGDRAMQIIRDLKPYPGGTNALVDLHKLDLIDKHRAILAVAGAGDFGQRYIPEIGPNRVTVQKSSVYILGDDRQFIADPVGHEGDMPFEINLTMDIVFASDGPLGNAPCVKALREMSELVASIVKLFQRECP
jgi:hypothetical protein